MGRAPCCDKANVKKGPWSPEEDAILKSYIHNFGTGGNWIALPTKIGLKRCGKSCRLRWLNYLRPNLKHGGFTDQEDNIICSLYISIGSRWSVIANQLPGRTDNDIKNYWNTKLKKKLLGRCCSSSSSLLDLQNLMSNSALERLQLHLHLLNYNNNNPLKLNQSLLNTQPQNGLVNAAADDDEPVNCLITTSSAADTTTTTSWFPMNMSTKTDHISYQAEIEHHLLETDNYMRSSSTELDDAAGGSKYDDVMNQQQQQEEIAWWSNEEQVLIHPNWDYSPTTYIC